MRLCIVTPTRKRWPWLRQQARAIHSQLGPDDKWVIVIDRDNPEDDAFEEIVGMFGMRLSFASLVYDRPSPPVGCVNRAYNVGHLFAEPDMGIVEVDDHDILKRTALPILRKALESGADYVFGDAQMQAIVDFPNQQAIEPWPSLRREYHYGCFTDGTVEALGVRAMRYSALRRAGGYRLDEWPDGDRKLAARIERDCGKIVHIPVDLCTITIDPDSIMGNYGRSLTPPRD